MPGTDMERIPPREPASLITQGLVAVLRQEFRLDWGGIHGAAHWARVRRNGLYSRA